MTQPDPRQQLRDLIAIRLHAAECGCPDYRRDDSDADDPLYTHMADVVLELFPDIRLAHEHRSPGLILPVAPHIPGQVRPTHRLFVLHTEPEPIRAEEPA